MTDTARRVVVSYPVGASREVKVALLKQGIEECAIEIAEMTTFGEALDALENAEWVMAVEAAHIKEGKGT